MSPRQPRQTRITSDRGESEAHTAPEREALDRPTVPPTPVPVANSRGRRSRVSEVAILPERGAADAPDVFDVATPTARGRVRAVPRSPVRGARPDAPIGEAVAGPAPVRVTIPAVSAVSDAVRQRLKAGREQHEVVGPLVGWLHSLGYEDGQLVYGRGEWKVPKTPSEASKRDRGESFEGFPVDIAIFDSVANVRDPHHVIGFIETKQPDEIGGVTQLEIYMNHEPHVQMGIWTNTPDPTASVVFSFRNNQGVLERHYRVLSTTPQAGQPFRATSQPLTYASLAAPSKDALQRIIKRLLDVVVSSDSNVTRREDQLDQVCGLLLLKLHSDQRLKLESSGNPTATPIFRTWSTPEQTAQNLRGAYEDLVNTMPDTFTTAQDRTLRLSDRTVHDCAEMLTPYLLIDVGTAAISAAFQLLRTEALKQGEGQYFTPEPVVRACIRLMQVSPADVLIDPAAGTGGFVVSALEDVQRQYPGAAVEISRWAQTNLFAIDKDAIGVKLTKAIMKIAGDGSAHCVRGDSIRKHLWQREFPHLQGALFSDGRFSKVVTNPPFGAGLIVKADDARLAGMDIASSRDQTTGQMSWRDLEIGIHFIQRGHQLLRMNGWLGIVLPETYFFSPTYGWLQEWMRQRFIPKYIVNIPMEAFTPFCRAKTNFYVFQKIA